jgi:hypothetical protein
MNDEDKKIIEHYQAYADKGMNAEDLFALAIKDGHKAPIGIGLLRHFFKMSLEDARNFAFAHSDKIHTTKKFDYYEVVKVLSERNEEGHIATATHNPVTDVWSYVVVMPPGNGEIYNLTESELQATGRKVKPIKKQGIIQFWAAVTQTGQVTELVKKLKYDYFDIVKIKSAEIKLAEVTGKNAVIISKVLVEDFPQTNKYGLYILNDHDEMQFYITADERHLEPTERKLANSFQARPEKLKIEDIQDLPIHPLENSSIKLSDKISLVVREVLTKYNFLNILNQYHNFQVSVTKEISQGETLISAHGPHASRYESHDIEIFETPLNLPRQESSSLCPNDLVQVKIYFSVRINIGDNKRAFEFRPYVLSLLVNVKNSTIWDARGKLAETD